MQCKPEPAAGKDLFPGRLVAAGLREARAGRPSVRGRWWLLDIETSGLDRESDSVIALRLARLENLEAVEEREILIRPDRPLTPFAERLTGITNRRLASAEPLPAALGQMERANASGCLLLLDQGFTLPFLENAFRRCGRPFSLCCLPLDRLTESLGIPGRQRTCRLLKALPLPPADWPDRSPGNPELARLYRLTLALFFQWEENNDLRNV